MPMLYLWRTTLTVALIAGLTTPLWGRVTASRSREDVRNALAGDPKAIKQGQVLFRQE